MDAEARLYDDNPGWWRSGLAEAYRRAVSGRLKLYRSGWLKTRSLPARVICVGNLAVGGTGKTPTVEFIARNIKERGRRAAVLSRGYRGKSQSAVSVVSDGEDILLGPSQAGDEAWLLAENLPGVPVLIGRDRWAVGRMALEHFKAEFLVMDDGFQHLGLARDVNLLLLDAKRPWGNGYLLPAGPLREGPEAAERATAFLLTRAMEEASPAAEELAARFPDRPIFYGAHRPVRLDHMDGEESCPVDYLKGRRVLAFCGLARPRAFLNTLAELGAEVVLAVKWPDHYRPKKKDLALIEAKARELDISDAVTTAKDAVKIGGRTIGNDLAPDLKVWVLEIELDLFGREDEFIDLMMGEEETG